MDHFARVAQRHLWEGRQWVVSIDLANAFGLLPKKAVVGPLRNLGFSNEAIKFIWRLVQIDTVEQKTGRTIRKHTIGIEQGNPLSALILNLALSRPLARLQSTLDIRALAFIDDIYLFARSEGEAHQAFNTLKAMLKSKGFRNVRGLEKPGALKPKASKILDPLCQ